LQIRPRDPETLFNLALLYTEIQQYSNAEETWRRYLAVDSTSAWAEEARSHLLEVQKKK
jgi:tetratricopeptide (TPR) repeat protein